MDAMQYTFICQRSCDLAVEKTRLGSFAFQKSVFESGGDKACDYNNSQTLNTVYEQETSLELSSERSTGNRACAAMITSRNIAL